MSSIFVFIALAVGSLLTFFSGFGLGTLMLPVFSLFLPLPLAVGAGAFIHLLNNIFKFTLVFKYIHLRTLLKFGLPAFLFAGIGAYSLHLLEGWNLPINYVLFSREFHTSPLQLSIAFLMLFFAFFELSPRLSKQTFDTKYLPIGGILSGFFGGISGHQGAFRSAFLARTNLEKQSFIATSNAIAIVVDLVRLSFYGLTIPLTKLNEHSNLLIIGLTGAFIGTFLGTRLLKKTTMETVKSFIGILLVLYALLIGSGFIG